MGKKRFAVEERDVLCKRTKDEALAVRKVFVAVEVRTGLVCRWLADRAGAERACAEFERDGL